MTPDDMLRWLNEGPLVQVGPKSVHENQLVWSQNPTLTLNDGSTVKFDDWVMQGPMVTDGTSWMTENQFIWNHQGGADQSPWLPQPDGTMIQLDQWLKQGPMVTDGTSWMPENQFLWNHRNDADQSPWLPQPDGSMVQLDQWVQQGPMVQDGSTWMTENQFLWNHQGEQWIFVPDAHDPTNSKGTMVPLDQWLTQGPMVTAPDGTQMTWNQFVYDHQGDFTPNAADPWEVTPDGHVMRRSAFIQWGPPTTGPDGKTMPQGQFMIDHPDDPHNPWIYLPYNPGDPNSYLDPQWLGTNGAGVSASAPLTATTLSDYMGKTAFDIDSMMGIKNELNDVHLSSIYDALIQLQSDMQGIETAIGDKAYHAVGEPQPLIPGLQIPNPFGHRYDYIPLETLMASNMQDSWSSVWSALTSVSVDQPGLFEVVTESMTYLANSLGSAAEMAWQAEKYTLDGIQKYAKEAGYDINVTLPDEPEPKLKNRGPR